MNTLQFQAFEIFKKHSFTAEEAELVIEYMKEAKSDSVAQKKDLEKLATKEMVEILATKDMVNNVKADLELKMKELEVNVIKWMAAFMVGQIGLIIAIIKLLDKN